jgi:hypothetical protein
MAAPIFSDAVDILSLPFGAINALWTGNPVGTFSVDGSIDVVSNASLVVNWYPTGTIVNNPAGSANSTLINLMGMGFRWLRLSYTPISGAGSLTVIMFAKGAGGTG